MENLKTIVEYFMTSLDELQELSKNGSNDFVIGEKTAYVEALELLQEIYDKQSLGLDFDIEERYPLC